MTKPELMSRLERMEGDMRCNVNFWSKRKDAFAKRTVEFYRGRLWLIQKFTEWVKELKL